MKKVSLPISYFQQHSEASGEGGAEKGSAGQTMAENIYENFQRARLEGITLKEPALPPPSKRTTAVITLLAILVLLLAALLAAVTVLFFQKERKLHGLEGLHLCNISNASLEESKGFQPLQNISVGFPEMQPCLESAIASQASLQERYGTLWELVSAGWRFYNGSFYSFSQETKPWQEAEQACMSHGVHLASVSSKEEMEFLVRESKGQGVWIGLTDQREEGNWTWTDGTTYNPQVSFWARGQPDNWNAAPEKQEDCVHLASDKLQSWNDISCGTRYRWICKKVFS